MSPGAACEKTIIDCVSSDRRPTERIYLKGFSGGDYVNGEWLAADDEAIFQRMEENTLHWDRWSSLIPGMYRSMFFIMNVNMRRDEQLLSRGLWIEPENLANEPGLFPVNEDPVEYFLFESQEGYCQHYASAAVLMYRLYGIPARYATGYVVLPDAFSARGEEYVAEVTDVSAHAWPEIYLENYGWVPVEVTPSSYEAAETAYLGLDMEALQDSLESVQWDLSALTQQTVEEPEEREELNGPRLSLPESEEIWRIVTYLVLFILAYGVLERGCRTWAVGSMSARALYDKWQQALYLRPGGIAALVEALRVSIHQDVGIIF